MSMGGHWSVAGGLSLLLWLQAAAAQTSLTWSTPEAVPTSPERRVRFADFAVDRHDRVHVVWREQSLDPAPDSKRTEYLLYAVLADGQWTPRREILRPQPVPLHGRLAVDDADTLHLLFTYRPGFGADIFYRLAPAESGFDIGMWQSAIMVNILGRSYSSAIATRGEQVFAVFDDAGADARACPYCGDVLFRQSRDRGRTWLDAIRLQATETGSARPQIAVDRGGMIHVAWDEGFDPPSGRGQRESGTYMASLDGVNWSAPLHVVFPQNNNTQISVGADGRGGVLLVWRTVSPKLSGVYFQWSGDWGQTWSDAGTVPGIQARPWTENDNYALAADAHGRIHLLAAGRTADSDATALFSLAWDGTAWSPPSRIDSDATPEQPRLIATDTGELQALWLSRASGDKLRLWCAHARLDPTDTGRPLAPLPSKFDYQPETVVRETRRKPYESGPLVNAAALRRLAACLVAAIVAVWATNSARAAWQRRRPR